MCKVDGDEPLPSGGHKKTPQNTSKLDSVACMYTTHIDQTIVQ